MALQNQIASYPPAVASIASFAPSRRQILRLHVFPSSNPNPKPVVALSFTPRASLFPAGRLEPCPRPQPPSLQCCFSELSTRLCMGLVCFNASSATSMPELASGGGNDDGADTGGNGHGGDGGGDGGSDSEGGNKNNKAEALVALASVGKTLADLPLDLAQAIEHGRIPASIVHRFVELEKNPVFSWLLRFGGFRERLLADDLFLTKVGIECGVGIFTKTAAELERRREKFKKELDFVVADVVMALCADFMLVWLPAPTVSLRPFSKQAGRLARFFYSCPDNAFQIALQGNTYSILQRFGSLVRNGGKLAFVGSSASLIGTGVTNSLIKARKKFNKDFDGEAEDMPVVSTSLAYGGYMAVSSNLRYQIVAGVIEQRILEPVLHQQKMLLSILCFAVRTGNTFLGSLMWVDYARWVGVQKARE